MGSACRFTGIQHRDVINDFTQNLRFHQSILHTSAASNYGVLKIFFGDCFQQMHVEGSQAR